MRWTVSGVLVCACVLGLGATAAAQLDIYSGAARYAPLWASTGFQPNPMSVGGWAGGAIDSAYLGQSASGPCRGYTEASPNHVMTLSTDINDLTVAVSAFEDTTLVILGPQGWWCIDDADGVNPALQGFWPAGTYYVWVGTYAWGTQPQYTLSLTERTGFQQPQQPAYGALDTSTAYGRYNPLSMTPGYYVEQNATGYAGGSIDAGYLGQSESGPCVGFTEAAPSHVVSLYGDFPQLWVGVEAQVDTTMLMYGPSGWWCIDDSDGVNPSLQGYFPAGNYLVWVGTFSPGQSAPYTFSLIEVQPPSQANASILDTATAYRRFASLALGTGFYPNPQVSTGTAGGPIDASYLGTSAAGPCRGFTESTPNHIMTLNNDFPNLWVEVTAAVDTTLLMYGPSGWWCIDDSNGFNPGLQGYFPAGSYSIWIGTYTPGQTPDYTMTVTQR